ncbi:MAG: hypothetical protein GWN11_07520, partial [Candidatus Dadabacteria bacterium]|nr:hypothetical protein [Candidatus Dadabacteria bacterium]
MTLSATSSIKVLLTLIVFIFFLSSCERSAIKTPQEAMRLAENPPALFDDLSLSDLEAALSQKIERLKEIEKERLIFGPVTIEKDDYILALKLLEVK